MNPVAQKKESVGFWLFAFLILHGLYAFTPCIRSMRIAMYIDFALVLFWTTVLFLNRKRYRLNETIYRILCISFIILSITVFYKLIGYSTAKIGTCMRYFGFFATISFGWFFVNNGSDRQKQGLLVFYSGVILVNVITNILLTLPFVNMGMESEEINETAISMNIPNFGDTSFTGCVFLCCIFYFVVLCYEKLWKNKLIALVVMGVCSFFTIICGMRGTTTILLITGVALIFLTKFLQRWDISNKAILFSILFIALLIYINLDTVVGFLVDISPSDRLAQRFNDVLYTSKNGIGDNSFTGRGALFKISLNSWLRTPITFLFGIGEPMIKDDFVKAGVSGHSDVLDLLAKLGVVGFFFVFRCFRLYYQHMTNVYKESSYCIIFKYVFWMVLIYGFLKTIFWENFAIVTFVLFPLIFDILYSESSAFKEP